MTKQAQCPKCLVWSDVEWDGFAFWWKEKEPGTGQPDCPNCGEIVLVETECDFREKPKSSIWIDGVEITPENAPLVYPMTGEQVRLAIQGGFEILGIDESDPVPFLVRVKFALGDLVGDAIRFAFLRISWITWIAIFQEWIPFDDFEDLFERFEADWINSLDFTR